MGIINNATTRLSRSPLSSFVSKPLLIFLVAIILRFGAAFWLPDSIVWRDGHRYDNIAMNLLEGKGFGSIMENRRSVPTQPILIASIYSIFGKNYFILRIFFAILGSVSCVLCYFLVKDLFSSTHAVFAGMLMAIYPYYIYISALFEYPQTFFILLMAIFFILYYRFLGSNRYFLLFPSGLCLGVAALSVPTVLIYIPLVCLHLLSKSFVESIKRLLVILIAISIPIGAWSVRNYAAYDEFILVNSASGINFWLANNETYYRYGKKSVIPACVSGYEESSYCKEKSALKNELNERGLHGKEYVHEDEARAWNNGMQFIRDNPVLFMQLMGKKFVEFWSPIPNAVSNKKASGGSMRDLISIFTYTPILILALWGVYLTIGRWRKLIPIYAYFIALSAPYLVFLPTTRYRLPLDFFLIMFAAVAIVHWWERKGKSLFSRFAYKGI